MLSAEQDQSQLKRGKAIHDKLEMTFEGVTEYVHPLSINPETNTVVPVLART
jgi:hypothetical protein